MRKPKKTKPQGKFREVFEVGSIYIRDGVCFIAVSPSILITRHRGEWVTTSPRNLGVFVVSHETQVDNLRAIWKVSREELDAMTKSFLYANLGKSPEDASPSFRSAQRRKAEELALFGVEKTSGRLVKCHPVRG